MSGTLQDKIALVTGSGSGIGRATALACAREGAKVVVADLNEDGGNETVDLIAKNGGDATFVLANVSDNDSVMGMVSKAVETYGRLDCAINNAGISQRDYAPVDELPEDVWNRLIAINLTGVMLCMKHEIKQMLKQGGGAIVNTASVSGLLALAGLPAYVASKHGVVGLTKTTALDFAKKNIRVNCVCPGYIGTPMLEKRAETTGEAQMAAQEPVGRLGRPEEIAEALLWLASDAASFVTGLAMAVDGAASAGLIPSGTQTDEK